ncbi:hypothetical protein [Paenibacillus donghaensis]|nr:hypothetical protein [Paenibacillus donghaensis]
MTWHQKRRRAGLGISQMLLSVVLYVPLISVFSSLDGSVTSLVVCLFLFCGGLVILISSRFS